MKVYTETELCSFATQCVIAPPPKRGKGDKGGKGDEGLLGTMDDYGGKCCALLERRVQHAEVEQLKRWS